MQGGKKILRQILVTQAENDFTEANQYFLISVEEDFFTVLEKFGRWRIQQLREEKKPASKLPEMKLTEEEEDEKRRKAFEKEVIYPKNCPRAVGLLKYSPFKICSPHVQLCGNLYMAAFYCFLKI